MHFGSSKSPNLQPSIVSPWTLTQSLQPWELQIKILFANEHARTNRLNKLEVMEVYLSDEIVAWILGGSPPYSFSQEYHEKSAALASRLTLKFMYNNVYIGNVNLGQSVQIGLNLLNLLIFYSSHCRSHIGCFDYLDFALYH